MTPAWILVAGLLSVAALRSQPLTAGNTEWRQNLSTMLKQPPAGANVRDLERFEQYLLAAAPYCTTLTPGDYEANRALIRNMTAYLATVNTAARDAQMRAVAGRITHAMAAFPCAYPTPKSGAEATPLAAAPGPSAPPFSLTAPETVNIPPAERETAQDLQTRYAADAARAASAWKNAETMRASLASRGMSLNAQTAASVDRLPRLLEDAAAQIQERNWAEAQDNLRAAEAETQKIVKAVGQ